MGHFSFCVGVKTAIWGVTPLDPPLKSSLVLVWIFDSCSFSSVTETDMRGAATTGMSTSKSLLDRTTADVGSGVTGPRPGPRSAGGTWS